MRRARTTLAALALAALVLPAQGCGSIVGRITPHGGFGPVYAGVQLDAEVIDDCRLWPATAAFFALDMPLSAALDTILLPVDLAGLARR